MSKNGCLWSNVFLVVFFLAPGFSAACSTSAWAQGGGTVLTPSGQVTTGQLEYRRYCAPCHGTSGKGNGPVAASLKKKPADLTLLSKDNDGKFPREHVYNVISGAAVVAAHGTREMPIWGIEMRRSPAHILGAGGTLHRSPEREKAEIDLIIDYIESVQVK